MIFKKIMSALMASAVAVSCMASGISAYDFPEPETAAVTSGAAGEMRGLTAFQLVSDMGAGWNLGNSLEVNSTDETYWGNPKTTKDMIDAVAAKGFRTLRIPVRWDFHYTDSSFTIEKSYLKRVEEVVNYGLDNDMYVIINIHHNDIQTKVSTDTSVQAAVCKEISTVWTQVGNYFKNYGDKLIFETINEPRNGEDWMGNTAYYDCVNKFNEAGRSAIRATGGNNSTRLIMMPTYCASADAPKVEGWKKLASDNMVAVSIHAYLPFDFAFEGSGHSDWLTSDYVSLDGVFERLHSAFISKGIPVVIGEFGATNKNNTSDRVKYAKSYIGLARQFAEENIPCVWWDNNVYGVGGEKFGLFNRDSRTFTYDSIASALVAAYEGDPPCETESSGENVIFEGSSSCDSYGQALALDDFPFLFEMGSGDKLYAEYSSSSTPTVILQDFDNSSKGWIEVYPDSISNGTAVWSYETIINAFGGSFSGLDKFYIGARESGLTLKKLYIPGGEAHTHVYNGTSVITLPATATTKGIRKISCSVSGCSAYKLEVIAETGTTPEPEPEPTPDPDPDPTPDPEPDPTPDPDPDPVSDPVADFVERLYTTLMGRTSDPKGKADHISRLKAGQSACDVAKGFVLSPELKGKKLSNKEFVTRMYKTMLDRDPDAEGLAKWTKALDNGCSYGYILQGFCGASEFTNLCASYGVTRGTYKSPEYRDYNADLTAYVSRMYTVAMGRSYDVTGLNNHTRNYINKTKDAKGIAKDFIFSPEFKQKNLTDEQFVECMYNTLFGRKSDSVGKNKWLANMKNGMSREQVFEGFAGAQEFKEMVAGFGV